MTRYDYSTYNCVYMHKCYKPWLGLRRREKMQRRERGVCNHYHLRPQMKIPSISGNVLRDDIRNMNQTTRKQRKSNCSDDWRPWAELPYELLDIISNLLRITEHFRFGRVCQNWRSVFLEFKQRFMASQPPLVVYITSRAKGTCLFYEISNGIRYEVKLPFFALKYCIGLSFGYIIMEDLFYNITLLDPLTGCQHLFSNAAHPTNSMSATDHTIFASTGPNRDHLVVVLSRLLRDVHFRRSSEDCWHIFSFAGKPWRIVDILIFKARVLLVASDAQFGILSLESPPDVIFLELKFTPHFHGDVRFLSSNEQLS